MKADNTNESDTERNMESFAPYMPPEVLQMVFHELDFFDLLRCQRVCKTWRACLPGNDPKLRDKLFVNRTRIQGSQDCVNDKENSGEHEFTHALLLHSNLEFRKHVGVPRGHLITPPTFFSSYASIRPFADGASEAIIFHPIINKRHKHLHIIFSSLFKFSSDKQ
ncbi:hypothetical protein J3E71DRAFT_346226 [Bipolaris maydis]|nr:hypothetical protein J3E71DRAFT_346226 [Bipolaris maydis]